MGHRKHKGSSRGSNNRKKVHNDDNAVISNGSGGSGRRSKKKAAAAAILTGGSKRGGSRQKKGGRGGTGTNGGIVRFGSSSSTADDYAFRKSLESGGSRSIHEMAADGNCLFRSLSDQLFGDYGKRCDAVRADICDFLESNEEEFKGFLILDDVDSGLEEDAKSFGEYVARMREEGEWGGNPELVAAARLYRRNITVFSAVGAFSIECGGDDPPSGTDLLISYHENDHYNSVWREDGSGQTERLITVVPSQQRRQKQPTGPPPGAASPPAVSDTDAASSREEGAASVNDASAADGGDGDALPPSTSPVSSSSTPLREEEPPPVNGLCCKGGRSGGRGGGGGGSGGGAMEQKRNDPCACGSGLKYKKCCLARRKREARLAKWREKHDLAPADVVEGGGGVVSDGGGGGAAEMLEGDFRVLRI